MATNYKVCEQFPFHLDDVDTPIFYDEILREFYLKRSQGTSVQLIKYCPFCGGELPVSLRDTWFDELEKLGISDPHDDDVNIPNEFKSVLWWKKKPLT